VPDKGVREEASAVCIAVRRDSEVGAVDEAARSEGAGVRGRIDKHLAAVAARDVEPRLAVDGLAERAVVLRPTPKAFAVSAHRHLGSDANRGELRDREVGPVADTGARRADSTVQ